MHAWAERVLQRNKSESSWRFLPIGTRVREELMREKRKKILKIQCDIICTGFVLHGCRRRWSEFAECTPTLAALFGAAAHPDRVIVGVCCQCSAECLEEQVLMSRHSRGLCAR
jgi:hypothetical protein